MNEIMLDEIRDQSTALQISLPILRKQLSGSKVNSEKFSRIILSGSGDSYFSAESLSYAINIETGKNVFVLPSLEALNYLNFSSTDLFVPISISGETKRTVLAATKAKRENAFVLSITSNKNSSLAAISNETLEIPFKSRTRKTPHTTDYLTTLLSIAVLIERLVGTPLTILEKLPEIIDQTINSSIDQSQKVASKIGHKNTYYLFGVGPNYGTCMYGAAKFWEARGIAAIPFELDEVGHGLHMVLEPEDVVIVPAVQGKSINRIREAVKGFDLINSKVIILTNQMSLFEDYEVFKLPEIPEEWSPFIACIPLQLLCWAISNSKGYCVTDGGRFSSNETYEKVLTYMRSE